MDRIKPKDVRGLSDEDLYNFSLYVQEVVNQIKFQIDEAQAVGDFDPMWMAKASYMRRSKGLLHQVVCRELADRKKARNEAKSKEHQFLIIKEVKELIGHDRYHQILAKLGLTSEDS